MTSVTNTERISKQADHSKNNDADSLLDTYNDHNRYRIALYYCYIDIENVSEHVNFHRSLCEENGLMGRIRVSREGINGVLSGRLSVLQDYEEKLRAELTRLHPNSDDNDDLGEFDVKYCHLRPDLPVKTQLFDSLMCKETSAVVSLFDPDHNTERNEKKKGYSKMSNRRRRRQQQRHAQKELLEEALPCNLRELAQKVPSMPGARHLSPEEWNEKLLNTEDAVLLDCRNVYESNVGYFSTDKAPTLLTNTRKYSDLPKVLAQSKDQWAHKKQIFMYCTGGVRCEVASKFVQALVEEENTDGQGEVEIYQLHGGIQRYLENYHTNEALVQHDKEQQIPEGHEKGPCLYRGKNFVFDPRRTDPMLDITNEKAVVGKCCICQKPHDDYDNGHAPLEEKEARCCKCRILLLVCDACRPTVQCWGEDHKHDLPKLYCGKEACNDYQVTGENPASFAQV